jgi:hypothetical protein
MQQILKYSVASCGVSPKARGEATLRRQDGTNLTSCFLSSLPIGYCPVQMVSAQVLPPSDHRQVQVVFPSLRQPPKGGPLRHQSVVCLVCFVYLGWGISLLVFSLLFGCLFVYFHLVSPCTGSCSQGFLHPKRGMM